MAKKDLIPVTERTKEEAKEISRKGGIKSGEVRREKACKGDSSAARLLAELNNENQVQGTTNIGTEGVNMHVTFTGKGGNNGENA